MPFHKMDLLGDNFMRSLSDTRVRLAVLAAAALVGLSASAWLGLAYVNDQLIVTEQEAVMRRVESANLDLQNAIDRIRDETQTRFQQLNADNDLLRARVSELEQKLSLPQLGRPSRPSAKPAATQRTSPGQLLTETGPTNFIAPRWVPNYFSDESGPLLGSSISPPVKASPIRRQHL
jgi:cell division protein FtsB